MRAIRIHAKAACCRLPRGRGQLTVPKPKPKRDGTTSKRSLLPAQAISTPLLGTQDTQPDVQVYDPQDTPVPGAGGGDGGGDNGGGGDTGEPTVTQTARPNPVPVPTPTTLVTTAVSDPRGSGGVSFCKNWTTNPDGSAVGTNCDGRPVQDSHGQPRCQEANSHSYMASIAPSPSSFVFTRYTLQVAISYLP